MLMFFLGIATHPSLTNCFGKM